MNVHVCSVARSLGTRDSGLGSSFIVVKVDPKTRTPEPRTPNPEPPNYRTTELPNYRTTEPPKGDTMSRSLPLDGRIAVVAGATRGAGRGIARALGEAGAVVYCTGRSVRGAPSAYNRPETIEETAEMVTAAGGTGVARPRRSHGRGGSRSALRARRARPRAPRRRSSTASLARTRCSAAGGRSGRPI